VASGLIGWQQRETGLEMAQINPPTATATKTAAAIAKNQMRNSRI
jgi:hypothetical protein